MIIIITVKYCLQLFSCQRLNHSRFPNHTCGEGSVVRVHSFIIGNSNIEAPNIKNTKSLLNTSIDKVFKIGMQLRYHILLA